MKFEQQYYEHIDFKRAKCLKEFITDLFVTSGDFFCIYLSDFPCVVATVT